MPWGGEGSLDEGGGGKDIIGRGRGGGGGACDSIFVLQGGPICWSLVHTNRMNIPLLQPQHLLPGHTSRSKPPHAQFDTPWRCSTEQ
jgi:hypothetical protein